MPKPVNIIIDLKEKIRLIKAAGITISRANDLSLEENADNEDMLTLSERVQKMLGIIKDRPIKSTTMNYLILYDIQDNKVRKIVAKYLEQKGCVRIQKSVFMSNSTHQQFMEIHETLKDVNEFYENSDSIIVVPVNVTDVRSMKLIGKNVNIDVLTDPPNTMFF